MRKLNTNDTTNHGRPLRGSEQFIYSQGYVPCDLAIVISNKRRLDKWLEIREEEHSKPIHTNR